MTISEEIRGLWRTLVPAVQMLVKAQHGFDTDKPSAKHRTNTTRRPYAPVGGTGARVYRPPSHRAR